jgi:lysozyme
VSTKQRIVVAALTLSFAGGVAILQREGYTDQAVIPTQGDVPTVGFGSTEGVALGDTTTPVRALLRAASELDTKYERAVKRCVKVPLHQGEYDVYVSMAYNIGVTNFCTNPKRPGQEGAIPRHANAGDYVGACNAILQYKFAAGFDCSTPGNRRCAGVWTDRLKDHARCMAAQ